MNFHRLFFAGALLTLATVLVPPTAARAELVLSQLVLELQPGKHARQDIEVWNNGGDIAYVAVEPREIIDAGTPAESSRQDPDPEKLGLLVSPARMVLDPGQRKLLRVAAIGTGVDRERVYRVTVRPVVGQLSSERAGLKILVAYDALVLVRPATPQPQVTGIRSGNMLTLRNEGNVSIELTDGRQCDATRKVCDPLPGGRLYAGAEKRVTIDPLRRASYVLKLPGKLVSKDF